MCQLRIVYFPIWSEIVFHYDRVFYTHTQDYLMILVTCSNVELFHISSSHVQHGNFNSINIISIKQTIDYSTIKLRSTDRNRSYFSKLENSSKNTLYYDFSTSSLDSVAYKHSIQLVYGTLQQIIFSNEKQSK